MVKPLRAGLLLSRIPIVTPKPTGFVEAYQKYMSELEQRLMWTFPSYFYFKRGTLAQRKFNDLQKGPVPRYKDVYYPNGLPDIHHNRDRRFKQDVVIMPDEQEKVRKQPRIDSSVDSDTKNLARKLDSTLFLLIKQGANWKIPSFDVQDTDSSLHEVTERGLREIGGENMNTWTVSNTPAALISSTDKPEFVIKSHIMHGKFQPKENTEFAWLSKEEIKEKVDSKYYEELAVLL